MLKFSSWSCLICLFVESFVKRHFVIPMGLFSHGKFRSLFPKESQLQQSPTIINYKVHSGSIRVSVIHRTRTWSTGSLTCVRDHSCACVYTRGLSTPTTSQHIWTRENSHFFLLCSWRGSNLWPLDLESDALRIEPPRHPLNIVCRQFAHLFGLVQI